MKFAGKWEAGWGSNQILFERQLDSLPATVNAELMKDVRDVEFDRTKTDHEFFRDLVIVKTIRQVAENIAFAFCQLLAIDLRLSNRVWIWSSAAESGLPVTQAVQKESPVNIRVLFWLRTKCSRRYPR